MAHDMKRALSLLEMMASDYQKETQRRLNLFSEGAAAHFKGVGQLLRARDEAIVSYGKAERDLISALELARATIAQAKAAGIKAQ